MTLFEAVPALVLDIEGALVRLGRGDIADQLRDAPLVAWGFDEFTQSTYLQLSAARDPDGPHETFSLHDEIGVNVELDRDRRVTGVEVSGYEQVLARLKKE
jgi:hypothetical protein